jgi:hypothetical protein
VRHGVAGMARHGEAWIGSAWCGMAWQARQVQVGLGQVLSARLVKAWQARSGRQGWNWIAMDRHGRHGQVWQGGVWRGGAWQAWFLF